MKQTKNQKKNKHEKHFLMKDKEQALAARAHV